MGFKDKILDVLSAVLVIVVMIVLAVVFFMIVLFIIKFASDLVFGNGGLSSDYAVLSAVILTAASLVGGSRYSYD